MVYVFLRGDNKDDYIFWKVLEVYQGVPTEVSMALDIHLNDIQEEIWFSTSDLDV